MFLRAKVNCEFYTNMYFSHTAIWVVRAEFSRVSQTTTIIPTGAHCERGFIKSGVTEKVASRGYRRS